MGIKYLFIGYKLLNNVILYFIVLRKKEINFTIKDKKGCHHPKLKIKN